ncbi:Hypoxic response protein 1 [Fervidicola ferrireducens]|uniref:Hypoxic response protein 1 n=1 Tax=Fervidicola ferrireducens TaxID=520764 RepID=A0A140L3Q7_9FIRM|nr:CBS domain-containing protein [Fervidicola ferrireducens]KXG75182.1 Hypoxic response protein 1 [Fervidicola ferrireducens]
MLAKDIMTTNVITVNPDTSLSEAINLLSENKINALPVVDEDMKILGIVTIGDIIKKCLPSYLDTLEDGFFLLNSQKFNSKTKDLRNVKVKEVMQKAYSIDEEDEMVHAAAIMVKKNIRHILVQKNGKLRGIISKIDIIRAIAKNT